MLGTASTKNAARQPKAAETRDDTPMPSPAPTTSPATM